MSRSISVLLGILSFGIGLISCVIVQAGDPETLLLLTNPLDPDLLNPDNLPDDGSIVTPDTISQSGLTIPSLWWTQEQFGSDLLNYWLAFSGADGIPARVDLLVNSQVWNNSSYLQRYSFLHHFGTSARDFGYSTRVFNYQGNLLGAYICDFDRPLFPPANPGLNSAGIDSTSIDSADEDALLDTTAPAIDSVPACQVFLNPSGAAALRGATPFGEL